MAERPSVKDILAAARKGGAAKGEVPQAASAQAETPEPQAAPAPAPSAPAPPTVGPAAPKPASGRPLSLKEKLAAARSGGAASPSPAPATPAPAEPEAPDAEATRVEVAAPKAPAAPLGRPLTMAEKLAAARGGGAPAAAASAPSGKPAPASKPAAAAARPAAARELPPLDEITDPRDLAEALRRAGADKEKAAKAEATAKAAEAAGATPGAAAAAAKAAALKKLESKTIPPKPARDAAAAPAPRGAAATPIARRPFLFGLGWIIAGWGAFAAAAATWGGALSRFMFPNVLAEPPSTVKVGLAANFEPEQVNERWKAEWGFWIVRSSAYDGEDKIYAIQSVCTHLGCPPNWLAAETKFKCPCHGSGFYISGVNFEGPAPRPLERFKVSVNDAGEIVVDKSQKYQEELKQWSDPDSYIIA